MSTQPQDGAEVIDLAARRRTETTVVPLEEPEPSVGKPRVHPPTGVPARGKVRLPAMPSGTGGVVMAVPKAFGRGLCCVGRGVRRGGDAWGRWITADGEKWDHTKKTAGWGMGGLMFVAILPGPIGWVILSVIGLVAAVVAGWAPTTTEELDGRDPDRTGSDPEKEQTGPGRVESGSDRTDPVTDRTGSDPATSGPVGSDRTERLAVGPPSTSPLVGRTGPVDVWTEPVRIGLDPLGGPVQMLVPGQPGLLSGGVSGSGKSVAAHQLLCHVALDPHAQLWLVDGKMVELIYYKELAHRHLDEPDLGAFTQLVDELGEEMQRRKRAIAGKAVKVTGKNWRTFDAPFILFHVDEIQIYSLQGKEGAKLAQKLALLASQCRALGIFVSVATQRPEDAVVPPLLCNNLVLKLAMRTEDAAQSNTILGTGMAGRGFRSDRFTGEQRGAGYFRGEAGLPVALTTGYLQIPDEGEAGDNHVRDIMALARKLREEAGTLPDPAAEPVPVSRVAIVASALEVMSDRSQITRPELAALLGYDDEDEMRNLLRTAGVCPPHSLTGETVRGWKRADLEAVMP